MTPPAPRPGPHNALTDVSGITVGHHTVIGEGFLTGTTVVLAPGAGMVAGVDVRGGGPATHETDLLAPTASVERIHALVLTGGSAYGLSSIAGVMAALEDRGFGLRVGPARGDLVPLVPGAALFDLGRGGDFRARPTAEFGAAALVAGLGDDSSVQQGGIGAGTGAVAGNLKGGIGTASLLLAGGFTVAALVAVNAAGSPIDPNTGVLLGARQLLVEDGQVPGTLDEAAREALRAATAPEQPGIEFADGGAISHTTLVVVTTDAELTKAQCTKMAAVAQNGLARAVNPVHTMFDGDIVFGAATGVAGVPDMVAFHEITASAADVVTRAIVRALLAAETTTTAAGRWPSYLDVIAGVGSG